MAIIFSAACLILSSLFTSMHLPKYLAEGNIDFEAGIINGSAFARRDRAGYFKKGVSKSGGKCELD